MKKIVTLAIFFISLTNIFSQNEKEWNINEIKKSIENKNEFIEYIIIDKNYYENKSEWNEKNNVLTFLNGEQAVYIYSYSTLFFFAKKNNKNYKTIINNIRKIGTKVNFKELEIRNEKLWVSTFKINSNYFFIYKDPANNDYLEISKNKEIHN
ncbi:MAG: hypothetical protein ACSHXA_17170 [Polaribacter sp.]|uniref:hypothetical protein n=1 Tax=Polaribacter sp. TaxID=1920175 RepID=UPI003EF9B570